MEDSLLEVVEDLIANCRDLPGLISAYRHLMLTNGSKVW